MVAHSCTDEDSLVVFDLLETLASVLLCFYYFFFFFQAEDGIRDVERSRGLGDVYKRQDY